MIPNKPRFVDLSNESRKALLAIEVRKWNHEALYFFQAKVFLTASAPFGKQGWF